LKIRKQAKPILENKKIGYTEAALGEEGGKPVLRSRLRSGEHDGGAQEGQGVRAGQAACVEIAACVWILIPIVQAT